MRCPKCNSENVQIQAKEYKPKLTVPIIITLTGFGMMFLGIVGAVVGVLLGLIIGAIVNGLLPQTYQGVIVCQNCGYTAPKQMICDGNLIIIREKSKTGNAVILEIQVDNGKCKPFAAGEHAAYNIQEGEHTIFYRQKAGFGKNERTGLYKFTISDGEKKTIRMKFSKTGLDIAEC